MAKFGHLRQCPSWSSLTESVSVPRDLEWKMTEVVSLPQGFAYNSMMKWLWRSLFLALEQLELSLQQSWFSSFLGPKVALHHHQTLRHLLFDVSNFLWSFAGTFTTSFPFLSSFGDSCRIYVIWVLKSYSIYNSVQPKFFLSPRRWLTYLHVL